MTNDECRNSKRAPELLAILALGFLRHWTFVLRHFLSCRTHSSSARRIADFCAAISLPMKTSWVSADSNRSRSQRPATKLKSCEESSKRTKPFARYTLLGRPPAKRSKQSREKLLSDVNVNDSNSG